jgi:hypothetical protein
MAKGLWARRTGAVVTAEEHSIVGGLGSAVAEVLSENFPVPMRRIGIKDAFGESGKPDELMKKYGIPMPEGGTASTLDEALIVARRIGYPLIVRPIIRAWWTGHGDSA